MKRTVSLISLLLICTMLFSCGTGTDSGSSSAAEGTQSAAPAPGTESSRDGEKPEAEGRLLITFGDSITALSNWGKTAAESCGMRCFNAGFGGMNTETALTRLDAFVTSRKPDIVTICFGMNDMLMTAKDKPQVTPERFAENLKSIAAKVRECGAVPVLMTANPLNPDVFYTSQGQNPEHYANVGSPSDWLMKYNDATRAVAAETDTALIDTYAQCMLSSQVVYRADGIHLSEAGSGIFAKALTKWISENYEIGSSGSKPDTGYATPESGGELSLLPGDAGEFFLPEAGTLVIKNEGGIYKMSNTNGLWPEAQYAFTTPVKVNKAAKLLCDIVTDQTYVAIVLYFGGATPNAYTDDQYLVVSQKLGYEIDPVSGDVLPHQHILFDAALSTLPLPAGAYDADGNIIISGVKIYIPGTANNAVTFRKFAVAAE